MEANEKLAGGMIMGTGLDGALDAMDKDGEQKDMHPEKRMKAAWKAYCELRMPEMKSEFPK